jgi:hypothetical protein
MVTLPAQPRTPCGLAVPRLMAAEVVTLPPPTRSDAAVMLTLRAVMANLERSMTILNCSMAMVQALLDGDSDDQQELRQWDLAALGLTT